jgi:hypothetical protein
MLAVYSVHDFELGEIDHEDSSLYDVDKIQIGSGENLAKVLQHAPGLEFDPPSTKVPDAGSSAIWPEQKTIPLCSTACEYGPIAAGACLV